MLNLLITLLLSLGSAVNPAITEKEDVVKFMLENKISISHIDLENKISLKDIITEDLGY